MVTFAVGAISTELNNTPMAKIQVRDLVFEDFIPKEEIERAVQSVADQINRDYKTKEPLLLAVLNGSFIFASDLVRKINVPCEVSFIKYTSYEGTATTGEVKQLIGLDKAIEGRDVILIEDIEIGRASCRERV